ncbi:hypothetical protein FA09DRAFT_165436 [Tilletiopsis washingtonensis]|uniref:Uncharacterized protein n=1 Tax=Tilletiopsis washingtonensis TaxID=58919 RepID=A0A316Z190_9BASI|nr:hypothetical protein FA09DRAFT_165436 [Tilletiopsis washingtonensis]PWN94718.1 hypothetical protein FA09DRAFT_165436 [Tilletiopsis washingtonensis]
MRLSARTAGEKVSGLACEWKAWLLRLTRWAEHRACRPCKLLRACTRRQALLEPSSSADRLHADAATAALLRTRSRSSTFCRSDQPISARRAPPPSASSCPGRGISVRALGPLSHASSAVLPAPCLTSQDSEARWLAVDLRPAMPADEVLSRGETAGRLLLCLPRGGGVTFVARLLWP